MSERMRRAFEKYNERVRTAAGDRRDNSAVAFEVEDDPMRAVVSGTDVPFDELAQLAEHQAATQLRLVGEGFDPLDVVAGMFRAAFLSGVFFAQDGEL